MEEKKLQGLLFLATCCERTYDQYENNGDFVIPKGFELITGFKATAFSSTEWFGFIIESNKHIIVAFRGTITDPDWVADAEVNQVNFPFAPNTGKTHYGFTSIYQSCRDEIISSLKKRPAHKKLYFTGHSLGAALATLAVVDAAENTQFTNPMICTFGSPRVGTPYFSKKYSSMIQKSIRVVNIFDLIPMVPPAQINIPFSSVTWKYKHVPSALNIYIQTGNVHGNHSLATYKKGLISLPLSSLRK
ncbi:lipase family protein [Anaerobacillus sp. MEB173]|uniref:lipase family protein n=1 Tax=Anaerobacillus sp. MEB173 TaxID=3383345 RepID=UPI003F93B4DC